MRGEELWVAACLGAALAGVKVEHHDDGSRPSMYDLDLVRAGQPFGACEVTAAADAESIELWNIINGGGERWIDRDLLGGWMVTVTPQCRAKRLKKELPGLLRTLEWVDAGPEREDATERLHGLEVVYADRSGTDFPGSIYITLQRSSERTRGVVASTGTASSPGLTPGCVSPHRSTTWRSCARLSDPNGIYSCCSRASRPRRSAPRTC